MDAQSAGRFEALAPADLRQALGYILAAPLSGGPAGQGQVAPFCTYLEQGSVAWEGLRCGPPAAPTALFLALRLPGRTGIVMIPPPGELGIDPAAQLAVTGAGLAALHRHRLHYAQALLEPEAVGKRALLEQAGFGPLASLLYLERSARFPWVDPPPASAVEWVRYGPATHAAFAVTVLATYQDSLDCPELTGLRPIEDILAAHQASGRFDPDLWELARRDGQTAGCALLSRAAQGPIVELVYMGVVPAWRGRGVGDLLLRRALARCREAGARHITAVVDARNTPARRLYDRFAFGPVARREAYLYRWPAA
jgi:ribosomal protein S18 acetylase RimI-like enzyme